MMPQGTGYANTAPSPIPGGGTNPAGMFTGLPNMGSSPVSPGMPTATSAIPTTMMPGASTGQPQSFFPANTGGSVPTSLANLSSGMFGPTAQGGNWNQNLYNELGRAYGKGTGQLLGNMLTQGLFNPQVAQALMQAMEPTIARGLNDVTSAFGAEGARFSSAGAIGAGDYMSQARLGQTAQLANLFQNAQAEQLGILGQVMPTLHAEQANHGSTLAHILEGAAGIGLDIVGAHGTGTALMDKALGMTPSSVPGSGGGGGISSWLQNLIHPTANTGDWTGGSVGGVSDPALNQPSYMPGGGVSAPTMEEISGGAALGGSNPFATGGDASSSLFPFAL